MSTERSALVHEKCLVPGVISHQMLEKCSSDQQLQQGLHPASEAVAKAQKTSLADVEEIDLGFLNILQIDNLWELRVVTCLCLNNNAIEKIDNLQMLSNLQHLDLSFNRIEIIENLDTLIHLRELSLFANKIAKLQNLTRLTRLEIFSLGNNAIAHLHDILELRCLASLVSLTLSGNPVASCQGYRQYVCVFLPLKYLDYSLIDERDRQNALTQMADEITHVELMEMSVRRSAST